ncbi:MAG: 16S rRNA (cytosine(1402)-N(4))-methyltransferase [Candidatus Neomarinimicrobiota bacterium]|nr:16S rRNA (cytosine(1402)-N(4))-methyltransferase RsmH [Candidatus Neomarinimicrobiota bacterium]RKY47710.1 MAG: 16S rRNA (cytosine(1402)-N(4))-methyltransferase [Candidatus Neomarinimicrobiota bacterium]RKY52722.1 MAG: 16S rRNA (cytosine(1402)-N(4))-methyltransferase [Candidatus Neomarinimicrobiota bacterium]
MNLHRPVLVEEVLKYLITNEDGVYIDCTAGTGGHLQVILEKLSSKSMVIAIDGDSKSIDICRERLKERENVIFVNDNFDQLRKIAFQNGYTKVDGILFDLGLSTYLLENSGRGFTYKKDEPLDMRFNTKEKYRARSFINNAPLDELRTELKKYSEDRYATRIAKYIVQEREKQPIETTGQLVSVIEKAVPRKDIIKTLSRIFQAIRIHVNKELEKLSSALEQTLPLLKEGGRLVVISYHSLEDRIVKNFLKLESSDCICPPDFPICTCGHKARFKILTEKPVTPTVEEIQSNPNARSAKLRAAERINA